MLFGLRYSGRLTSPRVEKKAQKRLLEKMRPEIG
jgi:hypothetical protein